MFLLAAFIQLKQNKQPDDRDRTKKKIGSPTYFYCHQTNQEKHHVHLLNKGKKLVLVPTFIVTRRTKENTDCTIHTGTTPTRQ
jgi:hypothetical protein